jgi:hypothetical protein
LLLLFLLLLLLLVVIAASCCCRCRRRRRGRRPLLRLWLWQIAPTPLTEAPQKYAFFNLYFKYLFRFLAQVSSIST